MTWLFVCIPLMVVAVLVATVPLVVATRHQHKYGHHGSRPGAQGATGGPSRPTTAVPSRSAVCPTCSALVIDQAAHDESVHVPVLV
jgi:hypothetical protein